MVRTASIDSGLPLAKLRCIESAPSGSTPYTAQRGRICFTAEATPAHSPPPPMGTMTASSSRACSQISRPIVAVPTAVTPRRNASGARSIIAHSAPRGLKLPACWKSSSLSSTCVPRPAACSTASPRHRHSGVSATSSRSRSRAARICSTVGAGASMAVSYDVHTFGVMGRALEVPTAGPLIPPHPTLPLLRKLAACCHACDLYKRATQTVFGEGGKSARAMMVGEQPGDVEDRVGRPFVGPAGKMLDRALAEAGIDRELVYVTNVVKHFKWKPRGRRRIHEKPNAREIAACRPWLDAELAVVKPRVLVCLGATAAQALLGKTFKVTEHRGELLRSELAPYVMATVHPSSLLRAPDDETRRRETQRFVQDLSRIAPLL